MLNFHHSRCDQDDGRTSCLKVLLVYLSILHALLRSVCHTPAERAPGEGVLDARGRGGQVAGGAAQDEQFL